MTQVNTEKLMHELLLAGISASGCNELGIVWDKDGHTEIQNRADVKAILKKHDPSPEIEESLEEKIDRLVEEKVKKILDEKEKS